MRQFREATQVEAEPVSKEDFILRVRKVERSQEVPALDDTPNIERFVLPHIIKDISDHAIMEKIVSWTSGLTPSNQAAQEEQIP